MDISIVPIGISKKDEEEIKNSNYGQYTRTSAYGFGSNQPWKPLSERIMSNPSLAKGGDDSKTKDNSSNSNSTEEV